MTDEFHGSDFFVIKNGLKYATPLLLVVGVIEFSDLLFAVDSIPAIFAIAPNDPFILYASNIFAILGLRSLYFLLANFIDKFAAPVSIASNSTGLVEETTIKLFISSIPFENFKSPAQLIG